MATAPHPHDTIRRPRQARCARQDGVKEGEAYDSLLLNPDRSDAGEEHLTVRDEQVLRSEEEFAAELRRPPQLAPRITILISTPISTQTTTRQRGSSRGHAHRQRVANALPPGWQIFPDGSIGPANAPSPIDSAWPTRVPQPGSYGSGGFPSSPQLTAPPGAPRGVTFGGDSLTMSPMSPEDMANMRGPDVMGPGSRNLRPGMSPTVRSGPGTFTDADILGAMGNTASGLVSRALPYAARVLGPLGAYFGSTTPAETGELPRQTLGRKPSGPAPFVQPQHPSTARYPMWPTPPAPAGGGAQPSVVGSPAPAVPPQRPSDVTAQNPDLGHYVLRDRPNADPTGGRRGSGGPLGMGMLDLSTLFQRPQQ